MAVLEHALRPFEQRIIADFKSFSVQQGGGKSRPRKGVWIKGHLSEVGENYVYAMWQEWRRFAITARFQQANLELGTYGSFRVYVYLLRKYGLVVPGKRERAKTTARQFQRQYYQLNRRKLTDPRWLNPFKPFPSWNAQKLRGFPRPKKKPRRVRPPMFPLPPRALSPAQMNRIWNTAEVFLREHGYTITREEFESIIPAWDLEAVDYKTLKERVGYVIHEAVEIEEVRKMAGRLVSPREVPEPVASRAHEIATRLDQEWLTS